MTARRSTLRSLGRALILPVILAVAGCATSAPPVADASIAATGDIYPAIDDNGVHIPAVAAGDFDPALRRRIVDDPTGEQPGTIVVDPGNHALYLVQPGGKALRYGVGVGREGMAWSGQATVSFKRAWPRWTPTKDMIARDPETYRPWSGGMDGGPDNPLGARALYLFEGGEDTLYRIHGTNDPSSIGQSMSSGCIRMLNQDVIDLFARVPVGTRVVVLPVGHG